MRRLFSALRAWWLVYIAPSPVQKPCAQRIPASIRTSLPIPPFPEHLDNRPVEIIGDNGEVLGTFDPTEKF